MLCLDPFTLHSFAIICILSRARFRLGDHRIAVPLQSLRDSEQSATLEGPKSAAAAFVAPGHEWNDDAFRCWPGRLEGAGHWRVSSVWIGCLYHSSLGGVLRLRTGSSTVGSRQDSNFVQLSGIYRLQTACNTFLPRIR